MEMSYKSSKTDYLFIFDGQAILTPRPGNSWIIELKETADYYKHTIICDNLFLEPTKITDTNEPILIESNNSQTILELDAVYYSNLTGPRERKFRSKFAKVLPIKVWVEEKLRKIEAILPSVQDDEEFGFFQEDEIKSIKEKIKKNELLYPQDIAVIENTLFDMDCSLSDEHYMTFVSYYDVKKR